MVEVWLGLGTKTALSAPGKDRGSNKYSVKVRAALSSCLQL